MSTNQSKLASDIDAMAAKLAKLAMLASPGPWKFDMKDCHRRPDYWDVTAANGQTVCTFPQMADEALLSTQANVKLFVALVNAWPQIRDALKKEGEGWTL